MAVPASPEPAISEPPAREWRIFVVPAVVTLVGYLFFYACDARLRSSRGPWEVTYRTDAAGTPELVIGQAGYGISNVVVRFPGEQLKPEEAAGLPKVMTVTSPDAKPAFGLLAYHDLMYLPGTVVLHCFGHEVQMLPRQLYLNRTGHPWTSGTSLDLRPETRLTNLNVEPKKRRRAPTTAEPPPMPRPGDAGTAPSP